MRQKVGIAVALARNARLLLLLDRPNSGLDPSAAADISVTVRAAAERGTARLNFDGYDAVPAFTTSVPRRVAERRALVALGCLVAGSPALVALSRRRLPGWPA